MKSLFTIIIFTVFINATAHAEGVISFGGNTVLMDFYGTLDTVIQQQKKVPMGLRIYPSLPAKLEALADKLRVQIIASPLIWNNEEVVMINYPELLKLEISLDRWKELPNSNIKETLVLHEALPLLGISDENYQTSKRLSKIASKIYSSEALFIYLLSSNYAPEYFAARAQNYFIPAAQELEFISVYLQQDENWAAVHKDALITIAGAYFDHLGRFSCYSNLFKADLLELSMRGDLTSVGIAEKAALWRENICPKIY